MALTVTHPFHNAKADGADATVVRPSDWNAAHDISGTLAASDITGLATSATTDATNASNISSGTLSNSRLSAVPNSALQTPPCLLYVKATVDFNVGSTDTQLPITLPSGFSRYKIIGTGLIISGASASLTTATFGLFTSSGGGGTALVASGTAITVNTASENTNLNMNSFNTINTSTESFNVTPLFFRVVNPQGSAATGVVTLFYFPVS